MSYSGFSKFSSADAQIIVVSDEIHGEEKNELNLLAPSELLEFGHCTCIRCYLQECSELNSDKMTEELRTCFMFNYFTHVMKLY